ncbi:hypothetical protein LPJ73_005158, partial [Coemansia sp. RSA 2703]
ISALSSAKSSSSSSSNTAASSQCQSAALDDDAETGGSVDKHKIIAELATPASSTPSSDTDNPIADLLPKTVTPVHYDIHLRPDIDSGKVTGSVCVDAIVNTSTQTVTLHTKTIVIECATVLARASTDSLVSRDITYDSDIETATIRLSAALEPGPVQIIIEFTGVLSDSMYGLYRSKYRDRQGQLASMLVTQFQAKCARMAFPCWDEPAIKAEFTLALTVPSSHTALSNMPVRHTAEDLGSCGLKTVFFERSPRMSTYLLAIVSGELDYVEGVSMSGPLVAKTGKRQPIVCRIYTAPADTEKVQFSLETAVKVLERLVDMFDVAYPLPKLDLVAVPELEAGGMENWGLVLFRTVRLFITKQTSLWIRQKAVYVIAHELSHQWFGNLVTMAWWDDLWLNEGFATWIGIHITDQMYPEWKRWDQFAIEDRQAALSADSLRSSHPIQVTIKGSADIDQVFDSITYYKGCALIRMLSAHLGIDVFMDGVRHYLRTHQYGTATTKDLWHALESASGEQVSELMHSWTTEVGYPVVTVTDDFESGTMTLQQNRYLHSGHVSEDEDRVVWWVPLAIISSTTTKTVHTTLQTRHGSMEIPGGSAATWVKLNTSNAGLYRVCYSPEALRRLGVAISKGSLSTVDVVGILNDMVALVISGYLRTSVLLDMIESFKSVGEYVVWQII